MAAARSPWCARTNWADLQAGIDALESLLEHPDYEEQAEELTTEIAELRSRLEGGDGS